MNFEYQVLAFIGMFFLFAFIPSSVAKYKTFGKQWYLSNRKQLQGVELNEWGGRVQRAHENLKDNLPAFVIAVLVLGQMNKFDEITPWICLVYLVARLCHFATYGFGIVPGRALSYLIALICNVVLLFKIFI